MNGIVAVIREIVDIMGSLVLIQVRLPNFGFLNLYNPHNK